jgi:hypothetical protein
MRWLLVLAALGGPALPLVAQSRSFVTVGSKVRLRIPAGDGTFLPRFDGTIERISGDTLTLRPKTGGGHRLYTPSNENQLLVLTAKRSAVARGATIGALTGILAAGFLVSLAPKECSGNSVLCFSRRHVAVRNAALLGGVGIVAGAIIGAFSPLKTWTRAWMPEAGPSPAVGAGGLGLGLSIAF